MTKCLSNPYFLYPGSPFRGYHNYDLYNSEVLRLVEFIKDQPFADLTHINIGAAMEERTSSVEYKKYFHWKQLFPTHVQDFILSTKNKEKRTQIITISPNITFSDQDYVEPSFLSISDHVFKWKKIENRKYVSEKYNVSIDIFYTMMPHNEIDRNKAIMAKIVMLKMVDEVPWVMKLKQTDYDIEFIKNFYDRLESWFESINEKNGVITIFSYAVFNEGTPFTQYNRYNMFNEIKRFFNKENNKRLLCEWVYELDNTMLSVHRSSNKISYTSSLILFLEDGGIFLL